MTKSGDIPEAKAFMNRFWAFIKEFYEVSEYDEYWERLMEEADKQVEGFNNFFSRSCVLGFVGWRDDVFKNRSNKNGAAKGLIRHLADQLTDDELRLLMDSIIQHRKIKEDQLKQITLDDIWREE